MLKIKHYPNYLGGWFLCQNDHLITYCQSSAVLDKASAVKYLSSSSQQMRHQLSNICCQSSGQQTRHQLSNICCQLSCQQTRHKLSAVISAVNCLLPTGVSTCRAAPDSLDCLVLAQNQDRNRTTNQCVSKLTSKQTSSKSKQIEILS